MIHGQRPIVHCNLRRSGRWRSEYTVDFDGGEVTGLIRVNVHYYENGNVRSCGGRAPFTLEI